MSMISCSQCQSRISAQARYCPACGAPVAATSDLHAIGVPLTTVQATSKRLKAHAALAVCLVIIGALGLVLQAASPPAAGGPLLISSALTVGGAVWYISARVRRWWHHD